MADMVLALCRELIFLILQLFREHNWKDKQHILKSESGVFFNVDYVEELVTRGKWEELEKYLARFICVDDNLYSVKMLFEPRKQRNLKAFNRKNTVKALKILKRDLKVFKTLNEDLFKDLALLTAMENFRVFPCAIAAHRFNPDLVALALSDGGVCVVEPLESDRELGRDSSAEAVPET